MMLKFAAFVSVVALPCAFAASSADAFAASVGGPGSSDRDIEGFFVDFSSSSCVGSCTGRPPCAGRKNHRWEPLFASLAECCSLGLSWKESECLSEGGHTGDSEAVPIFFVDWPSNLCVQDCFGDDPCANRPKSWWEKGYSSIGQCCSLALSWVSSDLCLRLHVEPTPSPLNTDIITPIPSTKPNRVTSLPTSTPSSVPTSDMPSTSQAPSVHVTKKPNLFDRPSQRPVIDATPHPLKQTTGVPTSKLTPTPSSVPTDEPSDKPSDEPSKMTPWTTDSPTAENTPSATPSPSMISSLTPPLADSSRAPSEYKTESPSNPPSIEVRENYWYPYLWAERCVLGPGYPWMKLKWNVHKYLFNSEEDCCDEHECVITEAPSASPSTAPTEAVFWYPDVYNEGGPCVLGRPFGWMLFPWNRPNYLFQHQEDCCEKHNSCKAKVEFLFLASETNSAKQSFTFNMACMLLATFILF